VLEKHWPGVHRVTDIRDFPDRDYGAITLVSGGFPCQPFSAAGKRRGTEDDRHLWPQMRRVIQAVKPSWVLAENVSGLLSIESGLVFESVLTDLEAEGYETWTGLIPALAVGGPHIRFRIFIIAHSGCKYGNVRRFKNGKGKNNENTSVKTRNIACMVQTIDAAWPTWGIKPRLCREDDGIPHRVDRLRALGNAVVPAQVYPILKAIAEVERAVQS